MFGAFSTSAMFGEMTKYDRWFHLACNWAQPTHSDLILCNHCLDLLPGTALIENSPYNLNVGIPCHLHSVGHSAGLVYKAHKFAAFMRFRPDPVGDVATRWIRFHLYDSQQSAGWVTFQGDLWRLNVSCFRFKSQGKGKFLEILRFFVGSIGQINYHFSFIIRRRHHRVVIYCNCGIFPNHTLNNSWFESIFSLCQRIRMLWTQWGKARSYKEKIGHP